MRANKQITYWSTTFHAILRTMITEGVPKIGKISAESLVSYSAEEGKKSWPPGEPEKARNLKIYEITLNQGPLVNSARRGNSFE